MGLRVLPPMSRAVAVLAAALVVALLGVAAGSASADPPGRTTYVPSSLTATVPTTHFVVHYDPTTPSPVASMSISQYAQLGAADFEEAYGRDVVGGGLAPNAGLLAPTPDDDGKTDVYLAAPKNRPGFSGGTVYTDSLPFESSYVFMTPDLARSGFRFRAAHEFMHVIQGAYTYRVGEGLLEAFANWAAEWALPDIDPLDNNFYPESYEAPHPWLPLDCSYAEWKAAPCGNGYWQWLFVQAQVESFGPGFVSGYYERFDATRNGDVAWLLDSQIQAMSGGSQTLSGRFAAYAVKVWDPTRWSTQSIARLLSEMDLQPAAYVYYVSTKDSGVQQIFVDHLAVRYVRVHNYDVVADPGDTVALSWTRPGGMVGDVGPLVKYAGQAAWTAVGSFGGTAGSASVPFGPDVEDVVLPLTNDSATADDQPFSYRVQLVDAPDTRRPRPRTRITKHPRRRTTEHLAVFRFTANERARFECGIDRRKFSRCRAKLRKQVKTGHHLLKVRAVDMAGNIDKTPARWAWTVVRRIPRR